MSAVNILAWLAINFAYSIGWFGAKGQVKIKQYNPERRGLSDFVAWDIIFGTEHMQVPRFWVTRGQSCTCPSSGVFNFYWYFIFAIG